MTIYGTVASKQELISLVARRAFDELDLPELKWTWQENLAAIMSSLRSLMLVHPSLPQIYATQRVPLDALGHAELTNAALRELRNGGIREEDTASDYVNLLTFTLGHVLFELPRRDDTDLSKGAAEIADVEDVQRFAAKHSLDYLDHHAPEFFHTESTTRSDSYNAGLRALIDGLGRRI
jgi:hypothetical protein